VVTNALSLVGQNTENNIKTRRNTTLARSCYYSQFSDTPRCLCDILFNTHFWDQTQAFIAHEVCAENPVHAKGKISAETKAKVTTICRKRQLCNLLSQTVGSQQDEFNTNIFSHLAKIVYYHFL